MNRPYRDCCLRASFRHSFQAHIGQPRRKIFMQAKVERFAFVLALGFFAVLVVGVGGSAASIAHAAANTATFTTFDPPGSLVTEPFAINPAGAITGPYFDASGIEHGFLRARDGTLTTFDPAVYVVRTCWTSWHWN